MVKKEACTKCCEGCQNNDGGVAKRCEFCGAVRGAVTLFFYWGGREGFTWVGVGAFFGGLLFLGHVWLVAKNPGITFTISMGFPVGNRQDV